MFNKALAALFLLVLSLVLVPARRDASSRSTERSDSASSHCSSCSK